MLQQMCRTCLATCGELVPIFSDDYYVHNLPEKLFHTIRIEIQKDDDLPKMMCKKCIFLVDSLFCFKDQCEMAEIKLKKTIRTTQFNDMNIVTDVSNYIDKSYEKYLLANDHSDALTSSEEDYHVEYASEEARLEVENARRRSRNAKKKRKKNIGVKVKSVEILPTQLNDDNYNNLSSGSVNDNNMEASEELIVSDSDDRSSLYFSEGSKTYYESSKLVEKSEFMTNLNCDEDQDDLSLKPVFKRKIESDSEYSHLSKVPKKVIFKDNGHIDDDIQFIEVAENQSNKNLESSLTKEAGDINALKKVGENENYSTNAVSAINICNLQDDAKSKENLDVRMQSLINKLIVSIPEVCHSCSEIFTSYSDALKHKTEFHLSLVQDSFCCPACEEKFLSKNDIVEHIDKHVDVRGFLCLLCLDSFYAEKNLRNHLYSHMNLKKLKCELCKKNFLRTQGLLNHIIQHALNKPLPCIFCTDKFESKDSLQSHINEQHKKLQHELSPNQSEENSKVLSYPCPYCEQTFSMKTTLRVHVFTHLGVPRFSCLVCDKFFNTQEERTKHMQEHMMPNQKKDCKKFRCRVCHEILISRVAYGEHLKEKHWNAKQTTEVLSQLSDTSTTDKINKKFSKSCTSLVSSSTIFT